MDELNWIDERTFEFGGARFLATVDDSQYNVESTVDRLLLLKAKWQLEQYLSLGTESQPQRIVELGIWQGGSTVFFEKAFHPLKLVAFDYGKPAPALDAYIVQNGLQDRLKPNYGVNQADRATVGAIVDKEFRGERLDLVVDDASHLLRETRESFNLLFPRLRPGGTYVIEDWGWEHWGTAWHRTPFVGTPPLTKLIFEICMTVASRRDITASILVLPAMAVVRRGDAELGVDFDISKSYLLRDPSDFASLFTMTDTRTVRLARRIRGLAGRGSKALRHAVRRIRDR